MPENKLSTWGVIKVSGPEAAKFLHTQLTNSVENQADDELRLAGFCTAKGRLLGTFFVVRQGETLFLVCKRDTIGPLVKRLTMFKLRSKCEISDATDTTTLSFSERVEQGPFKVSKQSDYQLLCSLRPDGNSDFMAGFVLNTSAPASADAADADTLFDQTLWSLGIAYVCADTVESFIPQSINFDLVGGIHFEKGCYPGQEVVARSHYIGKVKRRAFLASISTSGSVTPGQDVWMEGKNNEPAGSIVTVCHADQDNLVMIELVAQDALNEQSRFHLEGQAEHTFGVQAPPYDVMEKGSQFA